MWEQGRAKRTSQHAITNSSKLCNENEVFEVLQQTECCCKQWLDYLTIHNVHDKTLTERASKTGK